MRHGIPLLLLLLMLQSACSTTPSTLKTAPAGSPTLTRVQNQPEVHLKQRLIWGGTILRVENLESATRIEIVARPLDKSHQPLEGDRSTGRFIARFSRFLDPSIYSNGRSLTVIGRFEQIQRQPLDKMDYPYPLIEVESHHLWPLPEPQETYRDPFFYDPWYPFGYPYHYPFYHPYHYH